MILKSLTRVLGFILVLTGAQANAVELEVSGYQDVEAYFESVGYTHESWKDGNREVPNFSFTTISERWRKETVKEIDVVHKKRLFFRLLAPFGLKANLLVMEERDRLLKIIESGAENAADDEWLKDMVVKYRITKEKPEALSSEDLNELTVRIDMVPLSLILAQSAEESGWGTSRFTSEGNSLFGQWSWAENAMKPKEQRAELGNYGLAAFDTVLGAFISYIHNLNSGHAYEDLRAIRATMRANNEPIRGKELTEGLLKYSERGQEYVDGIQGIMRINKLAETDFTYLSDAEEIVFVKKID